MQSATMVIRWRIEGEKQGVFHTGSWMPAVPYPDPDEMLTIGQAKADGTASFRKPFGYCAEQFSKAMSTKERVRVEWEVENEQAEGGTGRVVVRRYVFERVRIVAVKPLRGAGPTEEVVIRVN
jgi:hypothetical protein